MWRQVLLCGLIFELVRNLALWFAFHQPRSELDAHSLPTSLLQRGARSARFRLHVWRHRTAGVVSKQYTEHVLEVRSPFCFNSTNAVLFIEASGSQRSVDPDATHRVQSFLQQKRVRVERVTSLEPVRRAIPNLTNETLVLNWFSRAAYFNPAHFAGEWLANWGLPRQFGASEGKRHAPVVLWWPAHAQHATSPLYACGTERDNQSIFCVYLHAMVTAYSRQQGRELPFRRNTVLCGSRLLLPGLLKSRFFRSPADAMAWRAAVLDHLGMKSAPAQRTMLPADTSGRDQCRAVPSIMPLWHRPSPRLQVTYLRRGAEKRSQAACRRRCLANEDAVVALLRRYREAYAYDFTIVEASANDITRSSVQRLVEMIQRTHVLISVHGAQLVYASLLPPWRSALIELFPYGFQHDMYAHAGGAPVHYFSVEGDSPPIPSSPLPFWERETDDMDAADLDFAAATATAHYPDSQTSSRVYLRDQAVQVPLRPLRRALQVALATLRDQACTDS